VIYRQETFTDDSGAVVFAKTPIEVSDLPGAAPRVLGDTVYFANFVFAFTIDTPNGKQQMQSTVTMPIDAMTIEGAFLALPKTAEKAKEKAALDLRAKLESAQRPALVVPGANGHAPNLRLSGARP